MEFEVSIEDLAGLLKGQEHIFCRPEGESVSIKLSKDDRQEFRKLSERLSEFQNALEDS